MFFPFCRRIIRLAAAEIFSTFAGLIEQWFRVPLLFGGGVLRMTLRCGGVSRSGGNAGGQSSLTDRYGPDAARPRRMRNGAAGSPAGAMQRFH
ncbi:MAG: hypothetical protein BHV63_00565 [Alistipes sp. 56_11]|nr:MAG: hypothetical protein BHV63_00565 [Alistipes sp. 56_11]